MPPLQCKAGTVTARTTTGTTAHTGIGFQPQLLLLWCNDTTADSAATVDSLHSHGAATSATEGSWQSFFSQDNLATSDVRSAHATDATSGKCIGFTRASSTLAFEAELDSFDSDGFTLNYTTVDGTARRIHYFAMRGDRMQAKVVVGNTRTTTGSQAYTGVGFQPEAIIFLFNRISAGTLSDTVHPQIGMGFADGTDGVSAIAGSRDAQAAASTRRFLSTANCISGYSSGGGIAFQAQFTSFDSDGFTLNWSHTEGTSREFVAVCLRGVGAECGSYSYPLTTTTKAITTGLDTKGIVNCGIAAGAGGFSAEIWCSGAASGTGERWAVGALDDSGADPMNANQHADTDELYVVRSDATTNLIAEADLSSLDRKGFTMDFTTVTGNADLVLYMAFGTKVRDVIGAGAIPRAR